MKARLLKLYRNVTARYLAGQALAGILANPEWMAVAKEECVKPGRGDIPDFFAKTAARYAQHTLSRVEEGDPYR